MLGRALGDGAVKLVVDDDVEVAWVLCVGRARDLAGDDLLGVDREDVVEVEDGLLPVGVLSMGS